MGVIAKFHVKITTKAGSSEMDLKGDRLTVGRTSDCAIVLDRPNVSRRHLILSYRNHETYVEDCGSVNGTFLNGERLTPQIARTFTAADTILLGASGISLQVFVDPPYTPPPEPEPAQEAEKPPIEDTDISSPPAHIASDADVKIPDSIPSVAMNNSGYDAQLSEARKQAAQILQNAEIAAERRAQEIVAKAHTIQQKADQLYKDQMKEGYREADRVHAEAQEQSQALIRQAREQSEKIRQEAEAFAQELRQRTETDSREILSSANERARQLREQHLAEGEKRLQEKMQTEIKNHEEKLQREVTTHQEKMADLQKSIDSLESDRKPLQTSLLELKAQIETEKSSLVGLQAEAKKLTELQHELAPLKENLESTRTQISAKQKELETLAAHLNSLKSEQSLIDKEAQARADQLKADHAEKLIKLAKEEETRLHALQLETTRKVEEFEKNLLREVQQRRATMEKEIYLAVDLAFSSVNKGEDKSKAFEPLQKRISQILSGGSDNTLGTTGKESRKQLKAMEASASQRTVFMSLFVGAFLGWAAMTAWQILQGDSSPLSRRIASEVKAQQEDLAQRKFNPPQVDEVKETYVDAVISTRGFASRYADESFQKEWFKAATDYLLKTWRIDEDHSLQALAVSTALVKTLAEKKDAIHPDYVKQGLAKMREQEAAAMARLKEILGTQVRVESYKKFEVQYFSQHR